VNVIHALLLVLAGVTFSWLLTRRLEGTALLLALPAMTVLLILVGDLFPRALGRRRPRSPAYRLGALLGLAVRVGSWATDIFADEDDEDVDDDDEPIDAAASKLISSVIDFSESIVREVMVPRTDMVMIGRDVPFEDLLKLFDEHGFSRVPVVGEGPDDVVGLVILKDLLPMLASGKRPGRLTSVMRTIDFVPETKRVPDLLREMQASKSHMAVVVDEYGGTAGIVTIEDLLEELVGEIVDEYDDEELLIEERGAGVWAVDGRLPVEELSELVDTELPNEDWDTVAGLVLGQAGRVPKESERFVVGDVGLTVAKMQGRRVVLVEVERLASSLIEGAG
jgi:CBS domain containing-hemolysin-like protein